MARKLVVWSVVLVALYYVLVELPAPTFESHKQGGEAAALVICIRVGHAVRAATRAAPASEIANTHHTCCQGRF